ncbi:MAG: divalent-cation tolerance protein CutA [Archangium gephyra]|uniref:Divalent-cation tolerance protein CutA n=1 Tax=Archangium gephyra TaxID=48 RepID=A0A2W5TAC8_9BACT|nr:MAG: divalent-cation tolerance protein CutA [Archangium gephyra]
MTAPNEENAAAIARTLVEEKWIACANLVPQVRSIYRWEAQICDEREVLVVMKTAADFEALKARVVSMHPYTVPELLKLEVVEGHTPYLDWVMGASRGA